MDGLIKDTGAAVDEQHQAFEKLLHKIEAINDDTDNALSGLDFYQ